MTERYGWRTSNEWNMISEPPEGVEVEWCEVVPLSQTNRRPFYRNVHDVDLWVLVGARTTLQPFRSGGRQTQMPTKVATLKRVNSFGSEITSTVVECNHDYAVYLPLKGRPE